MEIFTEDQWLSSILNKPSYKIASLNQNITKDHLANKDFIYIKIENYQIDIINHLISLNFSLIETNIILKSNKLNSYEYDNIECRFAMKEDEEELKKIAYESFKHSRFHVDERIPNEKANLLKAEWVSSFFKGKRGDWMVLAKYKNEICGFVQLIKENDNIIIDLIAVKKNFQGKGVGKTMLSYVKDKCANSNTSFFVGTQLSNINSINFYSNMGFKINNSKYTLHYHK